MGWIKRSRIHLIPNRMKSAGRIRTGHIWPCVIGMTSHACHFLERNVDWNGAIRRGNAAQNSGQPGSKSSLDLAFLSSFKRTNFVEDSLHRYISLGHQLVHLIQRLCTLLVSTPLLWSRLPCFPKLAASCVRGWLMSLNGLQIPTHKLGGSSAFGGANLSPFELWTSTASWNSSGSSVGNFTGSCCSCNSSQAVSCRTHALSLSLF